MTIDQPDLDDLGAELDASFGAGPTQATPAARLREGQRVLLRRRRIGAVASSLAVAGVVVATFAVLGPDGAEPQGADPAATGPSSAAASQQSLDAERQAELDELQRQAAEKAERLRKARLVSNQFPAALDDVDARLVVKDGWRVVQRVPEPVGYEPPEKSLGVVVTDGEQTRWMLLTLDTVRDENGVPIDGEVSASASADDAGKGYSRFEDWLASMIAINGGPQPPSLVTVNADDEVLAGPGTTLVDVQEVPVIERYTAPGDRVAEVTRDGRTWFVVVRGHGPDAELIPVDGAVLPSATLDALLAYLAQQVESGEGVR